MSTATITPEFQRANAESFLGKDPGKGSSTKAQGDKYRLSLYKQKLRDIKQLGKDVPVTILNMNPFPLKINGGALFPEEVPACPAGKPYSTYVLDAIRWQCKDNGCDAQNVEQMEPVPYVPLILAAEYIREYVQADYASGGVLCYVGDKHPSAFSKNELVDVPEISYDNGEFFVDTHKRVFSEIFATVKGKQKAYTLRSLQKANSWYENDHQRHFVNDTHRDLARLAKTEGWIEELPRWVMQDDQTKAHAEPCQSCQVVPKAGAILCSNCGDIFNVLEAFKRSRIAYTAVEMERLTEEEWKVAHKLHADRQKAKGKQA